MQAITTKYIGPANVKGSRVKATAQAGSVTLDWDDSLNSEQNHRIAAEALARKYGWHGTWISGWLPDGSAQCWTCFDDSKDCFFTVGKSEVAA